MKLNHNLLTIYIVLSENAKLIIIRIFRTTSQIREYFFLTLRVVGKFLNPECKSKFVIFSFPKTYILPRYLP